MCCLSWPYPLTVAKEKECWLPLRTEPNFPPNWHCSPPSPANLRDAGQGVCEFLLAFFFNSCETHGEPSLTSGSLSLSQSDSSNNGIRQRTPVCPLAPLLNTLLQTSQSWGFMPKNNPDHRPNSKPHTGSPTPFSENQMKHRYAGPSTALYMAA